MISFMFSFRLVLLLQFCRAAKQEQARKNCQLRPVAIGFRDMVKPLFSACPASSEGNGSCFPYVYARRLEDYRKPKYPRIKSTTTTTPIM